MTHWYVLFGHPERRRWEDARRYGFVSGGGGRRWSDRLRDLEVGDRVCYDRCSSFRRCRREWLVRVRWGRRRGDRGRAGALTRTAWTHG